MAYGDNITMPKGSEKSFQHLLGVIHEHCGTLKGTLRFIGIADSTYRKLVEDGRLVKSTAQKIADAYAKIAPYNQKVERNARAA